MPTPLLTADGSHTLVSDSGVLYHSQHGAIQESAHIFIEAGLNESARIFPQEELHILEVGFGTGLNAFLTALAADNLSRPIRYTSLELHPVSKALAATLNYPGTLGHAGLFASIHSCSWDAAVPLAPHFTLSKLRLDVASRLLPPGPFHCIFFDAFAPEDQPELWSREVFRTLYERTADRGVLTTYCVKGIVRRTMQMAGWAVEKLAGPPGKREIVRARRNA